MTLTAPGHPPTETGPGPAGKLHFCVDGWDPAYGTSLELEDALDTFSAQVLVDVDDPADSCRPMDANPNIARPTAMLFVHGVRRIEARVWRGHVAVASRGASA
jgi:hypothetical protein